jgi:hypothetical protein
MPDNRTLEAVRKSAAVGSSDRPCAAAGPATGRGGADCGAPDAQPRVVARKTVANAVRYDLDRTIRMVF